MSRRYEMLYNVKKLVSIVADICFYITYFIFFSKLICFKVVMKLTHVYKYISLVESMYSSEAATRGVL